MGIAEDLIIIILVGLFTGLAAHRLKFPPIIGYIIAGIIIGPYTGGISVSSISEIELLAEIGVALLLFSIGLDFSFKELKGVRAIALIGTPIQIILLVISGMALGKFWDFSWTASIVLGMVISLSSTMVVLKNLMNRGLMGSLSGKVMIGILITQDLAAIPLMLVIPELGSFAGGPGGNLGGIALTAFKAILILFLIIFVGIRIIPWILRYVAKLNSRELFLITITSIGLGIGYLTHLAGLSLAFGAFVAGMVISESEYSHQALNDIIPLRDIFGLVFFTSIGMLLDPAFLLENKTQIFLLVLFVTIAKFLVFYFLSLAFRFYNQMPFMLGFGLSQIGEFSFVLARTALNSDTIDKNFYSLMLSVTIITMIISPLFIALPDKAYRLFQKMVREKPVTPVNMPFENLSGHTIIAGGGRVGYQIASIFKKLDFPFILIEQDYSRFEQCKKAGFPAIYGDATAETVIKVSNLPSANMIVLTIPFLITAREIIGAAMKVNPEIKIIARANDLAQQNELFKMNIFEVVQPEFEASLEMIRQSLLHLGVAPTSINSFTDEIRRENYMPLIREDSSPLLDAKMHNLPLMLDLSWVEISKDSMMAGKSISGLEIRSKTGVSIVGILRNRAFNPNPHPDSLLQAGDFVAIIGMPENKKKFEELMATGNPV